LLFHTLNCSQRKGPEKVLHRSPKVPASKGPWTLAKVINWIDFFLRAERLGNQCFQQSSSGLDAGRLFTMAAPVFEQADIRPRRAKWRKSANRSVHAVSNAVEQLMFIIKDGFYDFYSERA
jgi:hypothetical protein